MTTNAPSSVPRFAAWILRAGYGFVCLWLVGVLVFLGYVAWGIAVGGSASIAPPAGGDGWNPLLLLVGGFGLFVVGLLFLFGLRRVEAHLRRTAAGPTSRPQ